MKTPELLLRIVSGYIRNVLQQSLRLLCNFAERTGRNGAFRYFASFACFSASAIFFPATALFLADAGVSGARSPLPRNQTEMPDGMPSEVSAV